MKITKQGKLPEDKTYKVTCINCKTEFECEKRELTEHYYDNRDHGWTYSVDCPFCHKGCFAYD